MNKWLLAAGVLGMASQTCVAATDDGVPSIKASIPSGTYAAVQNVTLLATDDTDKAPALYYTTNGKVATTASTRYNGQVIQAKDVKEGNSIDLKIRTLAVDKSGNWSRADFAYRIVPGTDLVKPVVTPSKAAGKYSSQQSITLSVTDNEDKVPKLYYTVDGTAPKATASYLYKSGTSLVAKDLGKDVDLRIRTLAIDASGNKATNTFDYSIDGGDVVAPVVTTTPAAGTYDKAQKVSISVSDDQDAAPKVYYTLDGSAPQTIPAQLYKVGSVLTIGETTLLRTLSVDAAGNQKSQEFKFTISTDTTAPSVTASPDAGSYTSGQTVTLKALDDKDPAPVLYYTTDGSLPQEVVGQLYKSGTSISVTDVGKDVDMTIKTLAVDASGNKSNNSFSYSIGAQKEGYYKTNPNGQKGKSKTITIDGSAADWSEDMIIAQGVANDDPRIFRGSHEGPVYDLYSLSAAWDDTNLYLMWQFTNVTDVADPGQGYPISDNGKPYQGNIPQGLAFDVDSTIGNDGSVSATKAMWDMMFRFANKEVDQLVYFSSKPGVGDASIYKLNSTTGLFAYGAPYETRFKAAGIEFKYGDGLSAKHVYGIKKNGYQGYLPADLADMSQFTDLLAAGHNPKQDTIYEMKIPLAAMGITKAQLESKGIGVMLLATFGKDTIESLPHDPTTLDHATEPYMEASTSAEKEDGDSFTVKFARIGK